MAGRKWPLFSGMPVANLPDMSVFAERLVAARKRKGWTQQQLAEAAGISITNVRNYEARGARKRRTWRSA